MLISGAARSFACWILVSGVLPGKYEMHSGYDGVYVPRVGELVSTPQVLTGHECGHLLMGVAKADTLSWCGS